MAAAKKLGALIMGFIHSVKNEKVRWQQEKHQEIAALHRSKALAKQALKAELAEKALEREHEISLLKQRYGTELVKLKARCEQDLKDYKHYLAAIDRLKVDIQKTYAPMPEAIALIIHHHAKQLLNRMWEAEDLQEKLKCERDLMRFIGAVHEDTWQFPAQAERGDSPRLPRRTMELIRQSS